MTVGKLAEHSLRAKHWASCLPSRLPVAQSPQQSPNKGCLPPVLLSAALDTLGHALLPKRSLLLALPASHSWFSSLRSLQLLLLSHF